MIDQDPNKKNNNYNSKEYKLKYWVISLKEDMIAKAQLIYNILDEETQKQISPDNFNLIEFINICLQKSDLSYNQLNFLKGLKNINETLNLNLESKLITINISFVEGIISL